MRQIDSYRVFWEATPRVPRLMWWGCVAMTAIWPYAVPAGSATWECQRLVDARPTVVNDLNRALRLSDFDSRMSIMGDHVYDQLELIQACFQSMGNRLDPRVLRQILETWAHVVDYDQIHDIAAYNLRFFEDQTALVHDTMNALVREGRITRKQADAIWLSIWIAHGVKYEGHG